MKPTKKQIENYIKCADDELGPESVEDWVKDVRAVLRQWADDTFPRRFSSKYAIGDLLNMKLPHSFFCGEVVAITFDRCDGTVYHLRRPDGSLVLLHERELCIRGVDHDVDEV